jgi:hypothetical protein
MADHDELIKTFKELQDNYIKALERENEELRKQLDSERQKTEQLEKALNDSKTLDALQEARRQIEKATKIPSDFWNQPPQPSINPWTTPIGPRDGSGNWGNQPIWTTSDRTTMIGTSSNGVTLEGTSFNSSAADMAQKYASMKNEVEKIMQHQALVRSLQDGGDDD